MPAPNYSDCVRDYKCASEHHDRLFHDFTAATWADPQLATHRRYVERYRLGFGDPAFHSMWKMLLTEAQNRFGNVEGLEIGVFKGQVVTLWALLAQTHGWSFRIHAITPFEGQPMPSARWWRSLKARVNPLFRERLLSGDFYPEDDYEQTVRSLFTHFQLDFDQVRWIRGYSQAPEVLAAVRAERFHIIYIDGGHAYETVRADLANFAPKVTTGGWLVMDDASCDLPGTVFWKGHESVSRACRQLPELGFKNVLNVGHNRIFEKV